MRARVLEITEGSMVRISCDAGELAVRATEVGDLAAGDEASIEFDVQAVLEMNHNAFATLSQTYSLQNIEGDVQMCGVVDGVDADGMVYFRLGPDSLTMIEALPGAFAENQWLQVCFPEALICVHVALRPG